MTKREEIVQAIISRVGGINEANGYNFTVGGEINVRRCLPIAEFNQAPMACVWELEESRTRTNYGMTRKVLIVRIEIAVATRIEHCYDANLVLADIEKALLTRSETDELWELVEDILDVKAEIARPQIGNPITGAALEFNIYYQTPIGNP
jgi:hypothetical protein